MGGNGGRQKKSSSSSSSSSSSFFSFFKSKASRKVKHAANDEPPRMLTILRSREDGVHWVAEPGIDRKASAFIARFHENRIAAAANS